MKLLKALLMVVGLIGCARANESFGELTPDQVQSMQKQQNVFIYDCNDAGTYAAAHVPGAKHLDYSKSTENDFPSNKAATLIFYCMNEH